MAKQLSVQPPWGFQHGSSSCPSNQRDHYLLLLFLRQAHGIAAQGIAATGLASGPALPARGGGDMAQQTCCILDDGKQTPTLSRFVPSIVHKHWNSTKPGLRIQGLSASMSAEKDVEWACRWVSCWTQVPKIAPVCWTRICRTYCMRVVLATRCGGMIADQFSEVKHPTSPHHEAD